ncbi:hypothetical protein SAMN05216511_7286 [Streptomyces sp. KS_16]|nr:hypothetical protein BX261_7417 [Streptomyces sp. 2321.6]SDR62137.1 hypothetical protein SAMN05216511_7286 [Streptomyces sp. KS_16]SEE50534.1 hypothetical protein SAMN05428940_7335 [Streptomyces sp. 2133.1]SNC77837.1 hypothetical protein SAMN06272741_7253 [Streptomyces sp. 2114.4]
MATPLPAVDAADLVTLKEIVQLLRPTPHPVSETKVRRWIKRYGIPVARRRGRDYVSFTDILEAQRDEADRLHAAP